MPDQKFQSPVIAGVSPSADELRRGALLYAIHEASRQISTQFDKVMEPHNLTRAQWWAIMHILINEGQSQSELARIMQMGRSAAGKLLDRLEAKGWVERRPDESDQRVLRVFLNKDANPALEALISGGAALYSAMLEGLEPEEERILLNGLRRISANAARAMGEAPREGWL
ncbi:MAG: MarR family transcriptional regulator [Paracoccus sp. (in: a-proteobacteria)]|uniref:MarR family winged helix-turn-helix transcriptional regulator n=1 Tax=Paracoccus sp. TaxID=267 RepID=UPI0039E49D57